MQNMTIEQLTNVISTIFGKNALVLASIKFKENEIIKILEKNFPDDFTDLNGFNITYNGNALGGVDFNRFTVDFPSKELSEDEILELFLNKLISNVKGDCTLEDICLVKKDIEIVIKSL